MAPSSETRNWDALVSMTLANYRPTLEDEISTGTPFFFMLSKKKNGEGWVGHDSLGERLEIPLMYEMGTADFYSGYDQLDVTPMEGITKAFWEWAQMAVPISISRIEERKNSGRFQQISLLKSKTKQALLGIQDLFSKALLQGNGPNSATAITTPFTSQSNGSVGFDPLPKLVSYTAALNTAVGNINPSTHTWWQNQVKNSAASNYAEFLKEMSGLWNLCARGVGGGPTMTLVDRLVYELYEAAMWSKHQNPSYQKADFPFDSLNFKGRPLVWDDFVPDIANGTIASIPVATSGSMWMLNTEYWSVHYDKETNFINTPFTKPENQDAKVSHILWYGATAVSNKRKQGAMGSIDTTLTS
jgi:hypothetical protein